MRSEPASELPVEGMEPYYATERGRAYVGDAREVLPQSASSSVDLVVTSPPFPLTFRKKKPYSSVGEDEFVDWLLPYAAECHRVLKDTGSLVLDLGGVWNKGAPVRSLYQYKVVIALCEHLGFHFAQDFYWYNPGALPAPAEWVNVRRIRVKSAVNQVFWLSKTEWPKSDNRQVLRPYSRDMLRLIARGYRPKQRPSGHTITTKFGRDRGGGHSAESAGLRQQRLEQPVPQGVRRSRPSGAPRPIPPRSAGVLRQALYGSRRHGARSVRRLERRWRGRRTAGTTLGGDRAGRGLPGRLALPIPFPTTYPSRFRATSASCVSHAPSSLCQIDGVRVRERATA